MNMFFSDSLINSKELAHLAKEVKKRQLDKTISAIDCLNEMRENTRKKQRLDIFRYFEN